VNAVPTVVVEVAPTSCLREVAQAAPDGVRRRQVVIRIWRQRSKPCPALLALKLSVACGASALDVLKQARGLAVGELGDQLLRYTENDPSRGSARSCREHLDRGRSRLA
jgi:hypothetical protein